MLTRSLLCFLSSLAAAVSVRAQPSAPAAPAAMLPAMHIHSSRVANQTPAGVSVMPVSALRFEPRVDVQARNMAEHQADVALRGGLFENTGFKLGAVTVYDPQTGHYLAELPVAPAMLTPPEILVGARNAAEGFNAGVGSVASSWRRIEGRGEAAVSFGNHGFNAQSFYEGWVGRRLGPVSVAADVSWSRSESDGSVPFGDHDFDRVAGRVQLRSDRGQTDFFGGYQAKFFGWPNLYTPFGFNETENLQTLLVAANHRQSYGAGSWWQGGAYYRRNKDDYEFNRAVPGALNPFQHTTHVRGAAFEGRHAAGDFALVYHAAWMDDHLRSTALTAGRFKDRAYWRLAMVPEIGRALPGGRWTLRLGAVYDDTDRDDAAVSPIFALDWRPGAAGAAVSQVYLEYAETTQVASYTALNSSPRSGLFRGNPALGRQTMRNLEVGARGEWQGWQFEAAIFRRWNDDLVDWTFRRGVLARTANPVDLRVSGLELIALRRTPRFDAVLSYAWLDKRADYGAALVDASFYALNFARHRITAAAVARWPAGWEVRVDNELRWQQENFLRTAGGASAFLTSVGVHFAPRQLPPLELAIQVDNLWEDDFQEVPAVPAAGRQYSASAVWRW